MSGPARLLTPQPARSHYAVGGNTRNSIPYAQAALPRSEFAQAVIDITCLIFGVLFACAAAIAVGASASILLNVRF